MSELKKLSLTQRFAILALNGQPIMQTTALKQERVRGMLCACFFDLFVNGHLTENHGIFDLQPFITELPTFVCFLAHYHNRKMTIKQWIHMLSSANRRILDDYENAATIDLITARLLDEVSDLAECDIMYEKTDHTSPRYRSDSEVFQKEYHRLRQLLSLSAYEKIPRETLILYWLMEETFLSETIFSPEELTLLNRSRAKLCWQNRFANGLFNLSLDHSGYIRSEKYSKLQNRLLDSKAGSLLTDFFPSLQRRETVFLSSEKLCKSPKECVEFAIDHLGKKGHRCQAVRLSDYPIIEVDNIPYKLIARTLKLEDDSPLPGVQLLPCTER